MATFRSMARWRATSRAARSPSVRVRTCAGPFPATVSGSAVRYGKLKGHSVVLAKTAKVMRDVLHQNLAVEPGAFFEGQCRRTDGAQSRDGASAVTHAPAAQS